MSAVLDSHTLTFPRPRSARAAAPATVRIALAGCGAVGGAFARSILSRAIPLRSLPARLEVSRVLVRDASRPRPVSLPADRIVTDPRGLLEGDVDVLVEALGGPEPAGAIAAEALARGIPVVTANKTLVAARGPDLTALALDRGTRIRFEAAVGGGVPVVAAVRDAARTGRLHSIRAILNGTSNFVLGRIERGETLETALDAARSLGLAEADASRDLDGSDAAEKLRILAWVAWGVSPADVDISVDGLLPDPERLVREAASRGRRIRVIAEARRVGTAVEATIRPVELEPGCSFAAVRDEDNRIELDLGWRAPLVLQGPGAGGVPTAAALLGDVLAEVAP